MDEVKKSPSAQIAKYDLLKPRDTLYGVWEFGILRHRTRALLTSLAGAVGVHCKPRRDWTFQERSEEAVGQVEGVVDPNSRPLL